MPRLFILLICVATLVQGRPQHHKHKKAHEASREKDDLLAQAYQQPIDDQAAAGPPKNINVYNMCVHKMGNDNKVAGHLDAHHVALCMQGPGMIQLSTTQQEVAPGEAKPDHTISVVKDTENSKDVRVMNVHSGHELPVVLPLSEPSTPNAAPKEAKPHDLKPPSEPAKLHTKPHPKAALHEQQHSPKAHAQEQASEQEESHEPTVLVHTNVNKEHANKVLTTLESTLPVETDHGKQKGGKEVVHRIHISNAGEPQKVFGQADSNNVAITMQGPGTASVTSQVPESSQTIIFDPMAVEKCPDKPCPQENGGKGHEK